MKKILLLIIPILSGCEPFYNPVEEDAVPSSLGSAWTGQTIDVKKTAEVPFDISDLSADMSLTRLLNIALYNNPGTRSSWNAARAAAYEYRTSLAPYYPTLDYFGSINAQTNKGPPVAISNSEGIVTTGVTTNTKTYRTFLINELSLNYLLFDFGGRDATAELALQTLYQTNWTHNLEMQQVMLSVLNAYTSYVGNKALVEAGKQNLHDAGVALQASQVMKSAGLATLTDVLQAQSNLESIRATLIQAEGSEKTSMGELLIDVGLPPDSPITVEQLPQDLPFFDISGGITELLETAKKNRPDLGAAIAVIKQQEAQLAVAYSNGMPTVSLNTGWAHTRFISPKGHSAYEELASLQVAFPIFQGFYYMNQQRELRASVQEALANLDVQLATVYTQVVTNYYAFKAAEAALPSVEAALQYSERAFRGYVVQYKTGTASILDVLNSLTTLSNARYQVAYTRTQWAAALANLAFSVGILDGSNGYWIKKPAEKSALPIQDDTQGQANLTGIDAKTAPQANEEKNEL